MCFTHCTHHMQAAPLLFFLGPFVPPFPLLSVSHMGYLELGIPLMLCYCYPPSSDRITGTTIGPPEEGVASYKTIVMKDNNITSTTDIHISTRRIHETNAPRNHSTCTMSENIISYNNETLVM